MDDKPLYPFHVCQVIHSFYPLLGGAERVAESLSRGMIERGLDVVLATRHHRGVPRYERIANVPVYRLGVGSLEVYDTSTMLRTRTVAGNIKRGGMLRMISSLIYILHTALWLLLRRPKCSIIHVHSIDSPLFAAMLIRVLTKRKLVVTIHGELARLKENRLGKLKLPLLKNLDGLIAISSECGRQMLTEGIEASRVHWIPNGVDVEQFKPPTAEEKTALRRAYDYDMDDRIVLYVGRLINLKRGDLLIRAWNSLSAITGAHLIIAGDGPERPKLEDLVRSSALNDSVRFVGATDDVLTYYQMADIFVLPSLSEGLSVALLEAMSCGLAVIVSETPGNLQVVELGVNGLSFPVHEPALLETCLLDTLSDVSLRTSLGEAARRTIVRDYSIEAVVQAHLDLYAALMREQ